MHFIERFFIQPHDNFFIFGPRGTGKSTWLKTHLKNAYFIDLLDEITFQRYISHPEHIKQVVAAHHDIRYFVIDEVQKAPKILDSLHQLIESKMSAQFIMTGSSARKLKQTGVNLLAGRALLKRFYPYMAAELGERFNLEHAINYGMIPLIFESPDPLQKLHAYIALYLKEEVYAEGLVRNLGSFTRFLEYAAFSHGSILNVNNIARESQSTRKVVENYITILEDLMLAYKLPVFTKRAKREAINHPKFYLFDTGVYHTLRPKGPLDKVTEISGIALEGLVLQHLVAWCDYSLEGSHCYYWRTRGGSEVDFIIYGENHFYALEVKNSSSTYSVDLRSLKAFREDYPECTPILLYRGQDKIYIDGIMCWPVEVFLKQLYPKKWPR